MNFKELFKTRPFLYFIFPLTNQCNLHCEWCSTLNHIPISPTSPHPYRRQPWEASIKDIELFCKRFKGYGESNVHRLTGSEATMVSIGKLKAVIDTFERYNRKTTMITNGYNLLGIGEEHINKLQEITLDDHGINHKHIERCAKYLHGFYMGNVKVLRHSVHWNLEDAMKHPSNKGRDCRSMMKTPMLVKDIIYPCCNMFPIEQIRKDPRITKELVDANWTLGNASIVETLRNWRETLPPYIISQCLNNCWRPNMKVGRYKKITLKPHDVICAGESVA